MPVHKRKKVEKRRGSKTHGWGSKKKHRGSGNKGGVGMAGTGKRGQSKKPTIIKLYGPEYFGRRGFHRPQLVIKHINAINLEDLKKFNKSDINLTELGYNKLLGKGKIYQKYNIIVNSFSKKAKQSIEKLGGTIKSG